MLTGTKERWRFLLVTTALLLLLGASLLLLSISMLARFLQAHLSTVSALFPATPAVAILAGLASIAAASLGLHLWRRKVEVSSGFHSFAVVLTVSALFCLAACVMAFRLREEVVYVFSAARVDPGMLRLYGREREVTERWDELHRTFECCGAGVNGYLDWTDEEDGVLKEVPDSCCVAESPGCGKALLFSRLDAASVAQRINARGCMVAIKEALAQPEVADMLHACAFLALLAGFLQMLLVFSVCCFAQHVRRFKNLNRLFLAAMNKDRDIDNRSISIIVEMPEEKDSIRSEERVSGSSSNVLDVHRSCGSSVECVSTAAAESHEGQGKGQNHVGIDETEIVRALDLASSKDVRQETIEEDDDCDDDSDNQKPVRRNRSLRGEINHAVDVC